MGRIMQYYKPKWVIIFGIIASIFTATNLPMFGYVLSKMVFTLMDTDDMEHFQQRRNRWIAGFGILVLIIGICTFIQKLIFGYGGENLTNKVRKKMYEAIIYKHIGWFDQKDRTSGVLTNMLIEDILNLNGLTTETISILIEAILGLVVSILICLRFDWRIALVSTALSPFMVAGGLFMSKLQFQSQEVEDNYRDSNALLSDVITNYRTVVSLGEKNVEYILKKYNNLLLTPNKKGIIRSHISGVLFGYS